jgi:hypothetical protein
MKHPYDDEGEDVNGELCVAKSFSLKRNLIAGVRAKSARLGVAMSVYVAALIRNDLARGLDAPLALGISPESKRPLPAQSITTSPSCPRGVVVPESDLD